MGLLAAEGEIERLMYIYVEKKSGKRGLWCWWRKVGKEGFVNISFRVEQLDRKEEKGESCT
jgi:hypothetical protein